MMAEEKIRERFCPATYGPDVVACQDDCLTCGRKEKAMSWPPRGWVRVGSGLGRDQFGGPGELEIALEKAAQTLIKGLKVEGS